MTDSAARALEVVRSVRSPFYIGGGVLIVLALVVRLAWYPVITSDYTYFVKVWFELLAERPGLSAFALPFADYAPLYLYFLKLLTFIPLSSLVLAKTLSLAFDVAIAWTGYRILARASLWRARPDILFFAAAVLFALPTVMMNSSLWGQSDALYGAGVLATLLSMIGGLPLLAALWFGFALSIKVQSIFFAPIFFGWLWRRHLLSRYAWIPALVFVLTVLPAWISGGNLWYWFFIYAYQAGKYPYLSVSAQSIFAFVEPLGVGAALSAVLFWVGIIAALLVALALIWYVRRIPIYTPRVLVLTALASVLIIPYLLPRMHERYFYLADLISVIYAFYNPSRFVIAVLIVFTSLISYMPFLSKQVSFLAGYNVDLRIPALLLLLPIGYVLYDLVRAWREAKSAPVAETAPGSAL